MGPIAGLVDDKLGPRELMLFGVPPTEPGFVVPRGNDSLTEFNPVDILATTVSVNVGFPTPYDGPQEVDEMIIDSHCHAWTRWPYQPPVPDDESRGRIEQLLFDMDQNEVDQAVVICAQIDRNRDNNSYIAEQARHHPHRIHQFPDVDCSWTETYHMPGAADRLRRIADRCQLLPQSKA